MTTDRLCAELLGPRPLLLDGPMGTQLLASRFDVERDLRGHRDDLAILALTRPDQVRAIHESYLERGARAVRTHTFFAHPERLAALGLGPEAEALHRTAVRAARAAVEFWGADERGPAHVLAAFGPALGPDASEDELARSAAGLGRQLDWTAADCDGILLETFGDVPGLRAAAGAVREVAPDRPLLVSLCCRGDGGLLGRGTLGEAVDVARDAGVLLLGVNCGPEPLAGREALRSLRERWEGPLGWWPNAGEGDDRVSPREFGAAVAEGVAELGLAAVGACCSALPAHLGALADELDLPTPRYPLDSPDP